MPPQDGCFVLDVPAHGVTRRTTRQSLAIARGLLRAGDLARAEQAFLQIARQDPLSGETRFFLGLIHQPAQGPGDRDPPLRARAAAGPRPCRGQE